MNQQTRVYPEHIQIETICGACTARCTMCTISSWQRPKKIMSLQSFEIIIRKLQNNNRQKFLTLHGLGEPLLDAELPEKISLAKKYGLNGVGFASNCTELNDKMSQRLLSSQLDTLICSIDGATKEIHESIRIGTMFEKVVNNVEQFIAMRNSMNAKTKILIRFINQPANAHEWDRYNAYWQAKLRKELGDGVLRFDVHNWGEDSKIDVSQSPGAVNMVTACADLNDRLIIQASGRLSFCCADDNDYFELGNALDSDPLELYNNPLFTTYRQVMSDGTLHNLHPCSTCSIVKSRQTRILPSE